MNAQLFALLRAFFGLTPTNNFVFPSECGFQTINEFLLNDILLNPHFQQYPPSVQYQKRFWKWAIENLEDLARKQQSEEDVDDDSEIDARIFDHYLSLMPPAGPPTGSSLPSIRNQICGKGVPLQGGPPAQSYITHFWSTSEHTPEVPISSKTDVVDVHQQNTATLLESRTMIESGTTGLRTWLASFVLAQYLILHPDLVDSKHILELGSGIGFLGIIIASLQQLHEKSALDSRASLWLTDINDEVLERCRDNVNLPANISSSHADINYLKLDWSVSLAEDNAPITSLIHEKIKPEVVLGADVVFDPSLIPALVRTIKIALQPSNESKVAIIALTLRNKETMNHFLNNARDESLEIEELPVGFEKTPFSETVETHNSCQDVKLFHITTAS